MSCYAIISDFLFPGILKFQDYGQPYNLAVLFLKTQTQQNAWYMLDRQKIFFWKPDSMLSISSLGDIYN